MTTRSNEGAHVDERLGLLGQQDAIGRNGQVADAGLGSGGMSMVACIFLPGRSAARAGRPSRRSATGRSSSRAPDARAWQARRKFSATGSDGFARGLLGTRKVGHAGTLDPLASGILPIALGEATKTVSFLMDADKTYRFTIAWGRTTATYDREGETCHTAGCSGIVKRFTQNGRSTFWCAACQRS